MVQSAIVTGEVDNMKCIYKSAQLIRQAINNFSKAGESQGNITISSTLDDVPAELYTLIHWILVEPAQELETEVRKNRVHRDALTISQNLMYSFKSKRQVTYQPKRECEVTDSIQSAIAKFVCAAYCPKGIQIFNIPELRWYLFCKHMAESVKLPPTIGALKQHILRVHLQASVWGQACIAQLTMY